MLTNKGKCGSRATLFFALLNGRRLIRFELKQVEPKHVEPKHVEPKQI